MEFTPLATSSSKCKAPKIKRTDIFPGLEEPYLTPKGRITKIRTPNAPKRRKDTQPKDIFISKVEKWCHRQADIPINITSYNRRGNNYLMLHQKTSRHKEDSIIINIANLDSLIKTLEHHSFSHNNPSIPELINVEKWTEARKAYKKELLNIYFDMARPIVSEIVEERCEGCLFNYANQLGHSCVEEDRLTLVKASFDRIFKSVDNASANDICLRRIQVKYPDFRVEIKKEELKSDNKWKNNLIKIFEQCYTVE